MYYKRSTGIILVRKSIDAPSWVKWVHHSEGKTHCPECLKLDGCFFTEVEHPPCPHHPYCHCTLEAIDYAIVLANVTVHSKYSKFDAYFLIRSENIIIIKPIYSACGAMMLKIFPG